MGLVYDSSRETLVRNMRYLIQEKGLRPDIAYMEAAKIQRSQKEKEKRQKNGNKK